MLEIVFDERVLRRLRRELSLAGSREIGGVLAAENRGEGVFRVVALSVQRTGGGVARFVRDAPTHRCFMRRFLSRAGGDFRRFNYLGEWHSHPCFHPVPSPTDMAQMQALAEDRNQHARFLVLVVVKLGGLGGLEASAHAFRPRHRPLAVCVREEAGSNLRVADAIGSGGAAALSALRRESISLRHGTIT